MSRPCYCCGGQLGSSEGPLDKPSITSRLAAAQVMKMFMPMLAPAAGTLRWRLPEGSILAPGDLIATLDLTDPGAVTQAVPFTGAHWGL